MLREDERGLRVVGVGGPARTHCGAALLCGGATICRRGAFPPDAQGGRVGGAARRHAAAAPFGFAEAEAIFRSFFGTNDPFATDALFGGDRNGVGDGPRRRGGADAGRGTRAGGAS